MRTNATATLRATMLGAAFVILALTGLPGLATADSEDCSPATCTSPDMGPSNHLDGETR
jgi:hypothetical protein